MNYLFDYLQQLSETGNLIPGFAKENKIGTVISQIKVRTNHLKSYFYIKNYV